MLEIVTVVGIFIAVLLIKNKIDCIRSNRETKTEIEKKKKARQDLLDKALERSIRD